MLVVRFPIVHHTINYDRVVLTSINVERIHDFINSEAEVAYEKIIASYTYNIRLKFLNGKLIENVILSGSMERIVSELMISKVPEVGGEIYRIELSMDFLSWDKTKYHFTYEGDFIC